MANIRISQLPTAPSAITGAELVPIVQNGQTVQATVADLVASPSQTQTFLTVNNEPSLPNSRYFGVGTGIGITDSGAQGRFSLFLNGTSGSLETAGYGLIAKTSAGVVAARTLVASGAGLSIANGNGISGNPTIAPTGLLYSLANLSGTGLLSSNGSALTPTSVSGTTNQITVANGNTAPVVGLASNPVVPGSAAITLPSGNTGARSSAPSFGMLRGNTDTQLLEAYLNGIWVNLAAGSGVTSIATGTGLTGGPITSTGTISIANTTVTAGSYGSATQTTAVTFNAQGQATAASNVTVTPTWSSITSTPTTIAGYGITDGVTLTGSQTLTNKTISGASNTLTNIGNSSLTNSSVTIGTTNIALGATSLTLGGLTSVAVTQDPVSALQLATKQYVDSVAQGLSTKSPVLVATTTNITLSGEQTIDGITTSLSRVLVKNQALPANNGIYLSSPTAWTRTTDANTWNQLVSAYVFVEEGSTQADTGWVCTVDPGGTLGVTAVTWAQFSGAGSYSAGTGLTLSGTVFSITNTAVTSGTYNYASITVNAQGQITSAAANTPVTTFSGGTTGLTPNTATTGAITLAGVLVASNGGTGVATLSGLAYGNGTSAFTAATAAQVVSVIGTTAVTNATNAANLLLVAGSGATNYITFSSTATGNVAQYTNTSLTYNYTNNAITGGISGGNF